MDFFCVHTLMTHWVALIILEIIFAFISKVRIIKSKFIIVLFQVGKFNFFLYKYGTGNIHYL